MSGTGSRKEPFEHSTFSKNRARFYGSRADGASMGRRGPRWWATRREPRDQPRARRLAKERADARDPSGTRRRAGALFRQRPIPELPASLPEQVEIPSLTMCGVKTSKRRATAEGPRRLDPSERHEDALLQIRKSTEGHAAPPSNVRESTAKTDDYAPGRAPPPQAAPRSRGG